MPEPKLEARVDEGVQKLRQTLLPYHLANLDNHCNQLIITFSYIHKFLLAGFGNLYNYREAILG